MGGRVSTANATWTNAPPPKEQCPTCQRPTSRSNLRMDAVSGRAVAICDHCHSPIPPRRKRA